MSENSGVSEDDMKGSGGEYILCELSLFQLNQEYPPLTLTFKLDFTGSGVDRDHKPFIAEL